MADLKISPREVVRMSRDESLIGLIVPDGFVDVALTSHHNQFAPK